MNGYRQFCGLAVALDVIGDRWNLLIVRELLIAPRRFGRLRAALPGIASNLLTDRLRDLEQAGIVHRADDPARKAVEYSLTAQGQDLREAVHALVRWGARFMAAGPRDGDTVRGEWLGLAAEALLAPAAEVRADVEIVTDGVTLDLARADDDAHARLRGPAAAVLGTVAGALPPAAATALGVTVEDPDGLLPAPARRA